MGTEVEATEEEFNVMLCLKFFKVGTLRDKTETFVKYRTISIQSRMSGGMVNTRQEQIPGQMPGATVKLMTVDKKKRLEQKSRRSNEQNLFKMGKPRREVA
eukprot:g33909.t1